MVHAKSTRSVRSSLRGPKRGCQPLRDEAIRKKRLHAIGLLKAYSDRHAVSIREIARRCGRNEKSVRMSFEATRAPTRRTIIAIAEALGFPKRVHLALLGELTWFVSYLHDELPLKYSGDKPAFVQPRLRLFRPDLVFPRFGGHSVKPIEDGRRSVQCKNRDKKLASDRRSRVSTSSKPFG